MKRFFIVITSTLLVLLSTSFITLNQQQNRYTDPAIYKLMEVTFLWELLNEEYEPDWDQDGTWLDTGLRSKYAMAKNYASLEMVEAAFGMPVFIRGPHNRNMDFNATTSFGYYNPAFISKLEVSVQSALQNPLFRKAIKYVYQQHLRSMAQTYHSAYLYLNKDADYRQDLQTEYLDLMARPQGIDGGSFQEKFRDYAENLERTQQADIYEAFTAPAFWLRRSIDGTAIQLFQLLDMFMREMER